MNKQTIWMHPGFPTLRSDCFLDLKTFEQMRPHLHSTLLKERANRRLAIGPLVLLNIESALTLWWQIQEMTWIENNPEGLEEERQTYLPLLPDKNRLTATLMISISDPEERKQWLGCLGGIETSVWLQIDQTVLWSYPVSGPDRSQASGETSAVHFVAWDLPESLKMDSESICVFGIQHDHYRYQTRCSVDRFQSWLVQEKEGIQYPV